MVKRGILVIGLTVIFLNGCGVSSESTAKEIVQDLEEKNYSTAGIVYEESTKGLSKGDKKNVDEAVSKAVIKFLENRYKELESDSSIEASFYNGLEKIEEIGIKDKALDMKLESYKQEDVSAEETDSLDAVEESEDSQTIFDMDWNTFKTNWYNSMVYSNIKLGIFTSETEEKQVLDSIRHNGVIGDSLYVCAISKGDTGKIISAIVIGSTKDSKTDVFTASLNLIKLTDPSLSMEARKGIALELGLGDGIMYENKDFSHFQNGITYTAEYVHNRGELATLTVSVDNF